VNWYTSKQLFAEKQQLSSASSVLHSPSPSHNWLCTAWSHLGYAAMVEDGRPKQEMDGTRRRQPELQGVVPSVHLHKVGGDGGSGG